MDETHIHYVNRRTDTHAHTCKNITVFLISYEISQFFQIWPLIYYKIVSNYIYSNGVMFKVNRANKIEKNGVNYISKHITKGKN